MANRAVTVERALYLYGVSRAAKRPHKISSPGMDGVHRVETVTCGDLLCWVSAIDHLTFSRELEQNMENLEWLALHGVRHQQVVAEIAQHQTIVPARFGTLFSGESALVKDVQSRKAVLKKVFAHINNADEWGVKVFAERRASPPATAPSAASGRDYLQQRAARLKRRPQRNNEADAGALTGFAAALEKVATDSAPSGKVSGAQPDLLWQTSFLVPRARRKQWDKVLRQYVKLWDGSRRIEINGPWPPYSFVTNAH